jgi:hypothetical protein
MNSGKGCGAILLVTLLAGCGALAPTSTSTPEPESKPEQRVNLSGYSASFKQGYSDGCESAGSRGQRRNESRFKTEADYMMGWNDGFSICQRRR